MTREPVIYSVDDDESVRDAFQLALVDEPCTVLTFPNGKKAVDHAQADRPDLVFLDLNMPVMDGVETLHHLHSIDPGIPVYIVTAFAEEYMERLREAREKGLKFQLASKPITDEQIRLIVSALVG